MENQTHRQTVKEKPSATIQKMTIDYIEQIKSIRDYGEVQFMLTNGL